MSGIFGLIHDAGEAAGLARLQKMQSAMAHWGPDGGGLWRDDHCGLGQCLLYNTPEALHERLPRWVPEARLAITAEARIDNRDELCDYFAIPPAERPTTPDSDLILRAYLKWGEASPEHLLGDWSFAVWHPDERKLFLARDHHGNTSLVYWQQGEQFAFASDPRPSTPSARPGDSTNSTWPRCSSPGRRTTAPRPSTWTFSACPQPMP